LERVKCHRCIKRKMKQNSSGEQFARERISVNFQREESFETSVRAIDVSRRARLRGKEVRSFRKKGRSVGALVCVRRARICGLIFHGARHALAAVLYVYAHVHTYATHTQCKRAVYRFTCGAMTVYLRFSDFTGRLLTSIGVATTVDSYPRGPLPCTNARELC